MFEEQVGWAAEAGVDFVIAETISWLGEALVATEVIKEAGLPAVVTLTAHKDPQHARRGVARGGVPAPRGGGRRRGRAQLQPRAADDAAAARGDPRRGIGAVAALPVPYRTTERAAQLPVARGPAWGRTSPAGRPFPTALDPFTCNRYEIADFARAAHELGVRYLGVCCGAAPHHIRSMAEALGRTPPASRYTADMSKHAYLGTDPTPAGRVPRVRRAALAPSSEARPLSGSRDRTVRVALAQVDPALGDVSENARRTRELLGPGASRGRRPGRSARAHAHGLRARAGERGRRPVGRRSRDRRAGRGGRRARLRRRLRRGGTGAHLQQRRLPGGRRGPARAPQALPADLRHLGGAQALHARGAPCAPSTRTASGGSRSSSAATPGSPRWRCWPSRTAPGC